MKRVWQTAARLLAGVFVTAMYAMPQAYTVSAKPGVINYIEGGTYLNGRPLSEKSLKATFLNTNDTLSTDTGKAEVLLTPGVFLRLGENSAVRMVSPSLVNTEIELTRGEAMLEVDQLVKDNHIALLDHGGQMTIEKTGLYRLTADNPPTAAVLDGKAWVTFNDRKVELKKGRQTTIGDVLKAEKFDTKKEDELYAWSNIRSEYNAAASYRAATSVSSNNYGGWGGFGFNGFYGPGWYWNSAFSSWAWLPANGAFYSPFGWGFYGPGLVGYAPVITAPVYAGGRLNRGHWDHNGSHWAKNGTTAAVPVSPTNPGAVGAAATSPWANHVARQQAARALAGSAFVNGNGAPVQGGHWAGRGMGAAGNPGWQGHPGWAGHDNGSGFHGAAAAPGGGFHGAAAAPGAGGGFHGGGMPAGGAAGAPRGGGRPAGH